MKVNALSFAKMIAFVQAGPCSAHDVAEHTGLSLRTVYDYLAALHRQHIIRIVGWDIDRLGRLTNTPQYAWGAGTDKRRKPTKGLAAAAAYRARKRASASGVVLAEAWAK